MPAWQRHLLKREAHTERRGEGKLRVNWKSGTVIQEIQLEMEADLERRVNGKW